MEDRKLMFRGRGRGVHSEACEAIGRRTPRRIHGYERSEREDAVAGRKSQQEKAERRWLRELLRSLHCLFNLIDFFVPLIVAVPFVVIVSDDVDVNTVVSFVVSLTFNLAHRLSSGSVCLGAVFETRTGREM
ncbi:hypothetical protein LINGRAHAP2_LOCUS22629, partial [Linum grandiflorum]